jgi:hypothetical protein
MNYQHLPRLGVGVGLRPVHLDEIFSSWPPVDWFEIISENFLEGGPALTNLEKILERYPVVMHCVSLSIGGAAPLDWDYLKKVKALAKKTKSPWISDHLCWGKLPGAHFHDLLPLPRTQEVVDYVAERARIVQDFLELPFALENLSSYASFTADTMSEWEFYSAVVEKADIGMMLDVNNVYVSSKNSGFDPYVYVNHLPLERVVQIHLAGHRNLGTHILDSHDSPVCDEVWQLYAQVYPKTGEASTLLEWDASYIPFEETWKEALKAKEFQKAYASS